MSATYGRTVVALPDECQYVHATGDAMPLSGVIALTHVALIVHRGRQVRAFIKAYDKRNSAKLLAEVLGYTLAHFTGVPQPAGAGILFVPGAKLRELAHKKLGTPAAQIQYDDDHLCFASVEVTDHNGGRVRTFGQATDWTAVGPREQEKAFFQLVNKWPHFAPLAALDAWLANQDRNLGNVLWVSEKNFVVIDHGEILAGYSALAQPCDTVFKHMFVDQIRIYRPKFPHKTLTACVDGCRAVSVGYAAARNDLNYWCSGRSQDLPYLAHVWLWKRLDRDTLIRVIKHAAGELV